MFALFLASLAGAPAALQPTGRWTVDFAEARCVASRDYGDESLALKASPMGDIVQLMLLRPGGYVPPQQLAGRFLEQGSATLPFSALMWSPAIKPPRRLITINLPLADFERLSAGTTLRIEIGGVQRQYQLGGMENLRKVMKSCVDDLQAMWGAPSGTPARAKANLASYLTPSDYPDDAIRNEWSGETGFALLVDENGKVADCMVTQTSGHAILDTQTCALIMRRAQFDPARDPGGKAVRDRVTSRIRWLIP